MNRLLLLILLVSPVIPASAQGMAGGTVYSDTNANGRRDRGEAVLAGIPVSNGCDVVVTDRRGRYRIARREDGCVFPILPAGYTVAGRRVVAAGWGSEAADFGLVPRPVSRDFRLRVLGDVQVSDYQELDYATRSLWPELMAAGSTEVNLFLGDLVNNNLALYPHLRRLMEALPARSWAVPGNHDRDVDTLRSRQNRTYRAQFGPDAYAFNEGDVHFICLNNVYGEGARGYRGRVSAEQLSFIRSDLALVPAGRRVVLAMHIPLATTKNRDEVLSLLAGRGDVLVLSGHLHRVMRYSYALGDVRVHELGAGAAGGFWWVGERDWQGVPMALQQGGTPRNYFVVDFRGRDYTFRCKGVGLDAARQMNIHVTGIDTLDRHLRDLPPDSVRRVVATVWGGCDSTLVSCRIDGGAWRECRPAKMVDPNVARVREMNLIKAYPTAYNRLNPLRHRDSPQVWTLPLTPQEATGAHTVEIEAHDKYGFRATGRRAYCFPTVPNTLETK